MSRPAVEFRPVTPNDIDHLAANLRDQDIAELEACGCSDFHKAIADGVARSTWCRAVHVKEGLICIVGVAPFGSLLDPRGVPWLLGTDLVPKNRGALARHSPVYIAHMLREFPHLLNTVHAHNTVSVRWLKRLGFTLHDAMPGGPRGEPFHLFEMRA